MLKSRLRVSNVKNFVRSDLQKAENIQIAAPPSVPQVEGGVCEDRLGDGGGERSPLHEHAHSMNARGAWCAFPEARQGGVVVSKGDTLRSLQFHVGLYFTPFMVKPHI